MFLGSASRALWVRAVSLPAVPLSRRAGLFSSSSFFLPVRCVANWSFFFGCAVSAIIKDRNCPVCLEFLHTSTGHLHVPSCGHIIHRECFQGLLRTSCVRQKARVNDVLSHPGKHNARYTCPTCHRSYDGMEAVFNAMEEEIAHTPMVRGCLVLCSR
jgi:hypothetical protein